jgi:hypothetical protein
MTYFGNQDEFDEGFLPSPFGRRAVGMRAWDDDSI